MCSADPRRFHENVRVRAQFVIPSTKNVAGEDDAGVGPGPILQRRDVIRDVRRITDDNTFQLGIQTPKSIYQVMGTILRHEPTHEKYIPVRLQTKMGQSLSGRLNLDLRTVRDIRRALTKTLLIIVLHDVRVCHIGGGQFRSQVLCKLYVLLGHRRPLLPLPIQPVDVENRLRPDQAGDPGSRAIAGNEIKGYVVTPRQRVQ